MTPHLFQHLYLYVNIPCYSMLDRELPSRTFVLVKNGTQDMSHWHGFRASLNTVLAMWTVEEPCDSQG